MKRVVVSLFLVVLACAAQAVGSKPVQVSLTPEIAVFDRDTTINGLTLSLWGENPQRALALGVVNGSTGDSVGLSLGLLLNYAENYTGVQVAPVNYVTGDLLGWQSALLNYTEGTMRGLQSGFVNYTGKLHGLQLGIFNYAEEAEAGVQLGLINIIRENTSWFAELPEELAPGMVLVNWRF